MKFSLAALAVVALFIAACSDDPVTPPADTFVTTKSGTYYVSNVDSVKNNPADTANPTYVPAGKDSTYITSTTLVAGRTAVMFRSLYTYNSTTKTDTSYLAQENNLIYSYYTLGVTDIPNVPPVVIARTWVRIGDLNATSWTALDTLIPNVSFMFGVTPITANVNVTLNGTKVGTETMTINGAAKTATHFKVAGIIKISSLVGDVFVYSQEDYWFVKDMGMVKYERGVTTAKGGILPAPIKINGKRKTTTTAQIF